MHVFPGKDLYSDVMEYEEAGGDPPPPPPAGLPTDRRFLPANPGRQAAFDVPDEAYSFPNVKKSKTLVTSVVRVRQDFRESWLWTEVTTGYLSTTGPLRGAMFFIKHGVRALDCMLCVFCRRKYITYSI